MPGTFISVHSSFQNSRARKPGKKLPSQSWRVTWKWNVTQPPRKRRDQHQRAKPRASETPFLSEDKPRRETLKNEEQDRSWIKIGKNHYKNSEGEQTPEKKTVMKNGIGEDSLDLSFKYGSKKKRNSERDE